MIQGIKINNPAVTSKIGEKKMIPTKKAAEKVKEITKILGQDYYKVEGMERDYIRGEILKV